MMCAPLSILNKKEVVKISSKLLLIREIIQNEHTKIALNEAQVLRLLLLGCLYMSISDDSATPFPYKSKKINDVFGGDFLAAYIEQPDLAISIYENDLIKGCYSEIKSVHLWEELLPYAFEVLDYSEQDLIGAWHDRRAGIITRKKHQSGIYYTPADVVKYMVRGCHDGLKEKKLSIERCSYIDFSCGSGVFLLQILDSLIEQGIIETPVQYVTFVTLNLFGIDISHHAIECTKYAILQHYMAAWKTADHICELFHVLEKNCVVSDSTMLEDFFAQHPTYPRAFNCIIGNPPYVEIAGGTSHSGKGNLFIPFVYNLQKYAERESVASLVLPLSFTYNSQTAFQKLRSDIAEDQAEWQIENYDRSPDSLFGDDVKARACIVFRISSKQKKLKTSGITRWTSQSRTALLSTRKPMADISGISIADYIPKLASAEEVNAFNLILSRTKDFHPSSVLDPQVPQHDVVIKGTAYNWICSYDHIPPAFNKDATRYISKDLKFIPERTEADQYLLLAILNSRVMFWLWTVIGDGFHVTNRLIAIAQRCQGSILGDDHTELARLGREFSEALRNHPTASVNSGKTITSYDHMPLLGIVKRIDAALARALRLNSAFVDYLEKWYDNIVLCGRSRKDI